MRGPVLVILLSLLALSAAQTWSIARSGLPSSLAGVNQLTLDVTGNTDAIAPNASNLVLSATTVDASSGSGSITVTCDIKDGGGSGVNDMSLFFVSPDGNNVSTTAMKSINWVSPDHAVVTFTISWSKWQASGSWKIGQLWASDNAGNTKTYTSADAGFGATVTVATTPDVQVPFAWSFDFAPQHLVIERGGGPLLSSGSHETFYISVAANDTASGLASVVAYFTHQASGQRIAQTLDLVDPVWDNHGGYLRAQTSALFSRSDFETEYPLAGTWALSWVAMTDNAGNVGYLMPNSTSWRADWPTQVTVVREYWPMIRHSDPFPMLLGASADKTAVNTNNGSVEVEYKVTISGDSFELEAYLIIKGPVVDGEATWRMVDAAPQSNPVKDSQITDSGRILVGKWTLSDYEQPLGAYTLVGIAIEDKTGLTRHAYGELPLEFEQALNRLQEAMGRLPSSASALTGSGLLALAASLVMAAVHML